MVIINKKIMKYLENDLYILPYVFYYKFIIKMFKQCGKVKTVCTIYLGWNDGKLTSLSKL